MYTHLVDGPLQHVSSCLVLEKLHRCWQEVSKNDIERARQLH